MIRAVAGAHALYWYLDADPRLSKTAKAAIDSANQNGDQIGVSSISLIEIAYLAEKGKVPIIAFDRIVALLNLPNGVFEETQVDQQVADALRKIDRAQVPDMPDRIIAATALMLGVPVISRDGKIQSSIVTTIW
ncbi:MAG TPA: type II toxin-antitoxin system VapC family toxin [Blastocatellia bacterium]|nr:type II toxin-antitoxin system VapC family toxin [Blastocatellia bacterium]